MKYWTFFLLSIFCFISCGPKTIYKETKLIPNGSWPKGSPVVFDIDIKDTTSKYDIILSVDAKEDFRYTNLYVSVKTTFPNNTSSDDIVSLELSKSNGDSNGKCSSGSCSVPILFQHNINFAQLGKYVIAIDQHSREKMIEGIEQFELKIVENREVEK
jgi:gliding motility-associated lipoprotein GldH